MIGTLLGNRYEVQERLGGGGMAIVYRALDTFLNRTVSIKVLRSAYASDEEFVRKFRREAQAAASLSHPNIVNIYDVGQDGEVYYIVMEYVDGLNLKQLIERRAPLAIEEAVDIAKQICDALTQAHEHNIVHRDIKPHNIMLRKDGRVKVTDFGIARAITANTITHHNSVAFGSVHYFSPEQAKGAVTDVKSDVYSLGVVLYEMVTGQLPFVGETPVSIALKHLQEPFVEPRKLNASVPQSVENVILRALAKDPIVRFASTREMAGDLDIALSNPNVPKFIVPKTVMDQDTKEVEVLGSKLPEIPTEETGELGKGNGKKKRKFWRPVVWLFMAFIAIGIVMVGSLGGYSIFMHLGQTKDLSVPGVIGLQYDAARQQLVDSGFQTANIVRRDLASNKYASGIVFQQDPSANDTVKQTHMVTLTVSSGPEQLSMPSLANYTVATAKQQLTQLGIPDKNITTVEQTSNSVQSGQVISTVPASGDKITVASMIQLTVSKGQDQVAIPDVSGKNSNDASQLLQTNGLVLGQKHYSSSWSVPKDQVTGITPPNQIGQKVNRGQSIDLEVSSGVPSDAQKTVADVAIQVDPNNVPLQVTIVVSDAQGDNRKVVDEKISANKTYHVNVYTEPNKDGILDTYENGQLKDHRTIPYQ